MSKKKKIILAVVIIVAIAAVSVGFFLKGKLGKSSGGGDAAYVESVQSLVNGSNGGGQNPLYGCCGISGYLGRESDIRPDGERNFCIRR